MNSFRYCYALIAFIAINACNAQDSEPLTNHYEEWSKCTKSNTKYIFVNEITEIKKKISQKRIESHESLLEIIGSELNENMKLLINSALIQTVKLSNDINKNFHNFSKRSYAYQYTFGSIFVRDYQNYFETVKCISSNGEDYRIDLAHIMLPALELVSEYNRNRTNNCCLPSDCIIAKDFQYLFAIAANMVGKLNEFADEEALKKSYDVLFNKKFSDEEYEYILSLLEN